MMGDRRATDARKFVARQADTEVTTAEVQPDLSELWSEDGASLETLQAIVDSGLAWRLEGSIGRSVYDLIQAGQLMLGEVGHRDYYGNYVPSRYEVEAGTPGSPEYYEEHHG